MSSSRLGVGPIRFLVLMIAVLATPVAAPAQEAKPEGEPAAGMPVAAPGRVDPHDIAVPAGAVRTYIDACRRGDYEQAAKRLDLSALPLDERAEAGPSLARRFKVVLDRKLWIQFELLSEIPTGDLGDGLPADLDRIDNDEGEIEVYLERVTEADGSQVWKVAASTVARIPEYWDAYGYGPLFELLPAPMFEIRFLEMMLWQWIGLLLLVPLAWIGSWLSARILLAVIRPLVSRTRSDLDDRLLEMLTPPCRLLLLVLLFSVGTYALKLSVKAYEFLGAAGTAATLIAVTWVALRAVDVITEVLRARLERAGRRSAVAVLPLGRRSAQVFLVVLALIGVLQNLGFNVTGLLAGLGVGGLAVALAAQKSLENLFGGVTLIADQPVRVGDFCRFDGKVGTIEEIGLRSTRIRTLDRTRISVPNSAFSEIQLENYALRDRIRLTTTLGLRYETTPDQLRHVLAELRKVLVAHPKVSNDPARVRFSNFGDSSLDVEVLAYVLTTDFSEFVAVREDLYLRFMDVIDKSGTGFAFPSQTLYMAKDDGLNEERSREAEAQVRRWRDEGRLPFPELSEATVAELDGSLDYPPRGSVLSQAQESERQVGGENER